MASLDFRNVFKVYNGNIEAVNNFCLNIKDQEFIVLLGPSGCGKSTILRMVAGLEEISSGELFIDKKLVNGLPPKDRNIAMVFQDYALYPHMSVYENMAFCLKLRKIPRHKIHQKIIESATILGIEDLLKRKPGALSGGQRQRVALGRALVREPQVFLMDEPLSNLDAKLRVQTRTEIIKLHHKLQTTFIYVTHDQTEAMTMGDRIVIMKDGEIQQVGTPQEVYYKPLNTFVASFIGSPQINFFNALVESDDTRHYYLTLAGVKINLSPEKAAPLKEKGYSGKNIILGIRPEDICEESKYTGSVRDAPIKVKIELIEMMGAEKYLYFNVDGNNAVARVSSEFKTEVGSIVRLSINSEKILLFDIETKKSIFLQ